MSSTPRACSTSSTPNWRNSKGAREGRLLHQARNELRDIAFFIARDNPTRARSFVRELRTKAEEVAARPLAFALAPGHEASEIRRRIYGRYLIFFRVERDAIQIVHIAHGA